MICLCRFSDGYTLQAKVKGLETWSPDAPPPPEPSSSEQPPPYSTEAQSVITHGVTNAVKHFIEQSFPGSILTEEHQVHVEYIILYTNVPAHV